MPSAFTWLATQMSAKEGAVSALSVNVVEVVTSTVMMARARLPVTTVKSPELAGEPQVPATDTPFTEVTIPGSALCRAVAPAETAEGAEGGPW